MSGHRIITSSANTFFYAATKCAVTALTEGMRRELREMNSDVKVTVRRADIVHMHVSEGLVYTALYFCTSC
jgi:short-subunit dehydrogenase